MSVKVILISYLMGNSLVVQDLSPSYRQNDSRKYGANSINATHGCECKYALRIFMKTV